MIVIIPTNGNCDEKALFEAYDETTPDDVILLGCYATLAEAHLVYPDAPLVDY